MHRNNVDTVKSSLNKDEINTVVDVRREGASEYDTTARTGSQGQNTVNSSSARKKIIQIHQKRKQNASVTLQIESPKRADLLDTSIGTVTSNIHYNNDEVLAISLPMATN